MYHVLAESTDRRIAGFWAEAATMQAAMKIGARLWQEGFLVSITGPDGSLFEATGGRKGRDADTLQRSTSDPSAHPQRNAVAGGSTGRMANM
jgi:hypothetical protein